MEKNRLIAILCGLGAALLVIMAGRSCMGDTGKKKSQGTGGNGYVIDMPSEDPDYFEDPYDQFTVPIVTDYDVFGNVIIVTEPVTPPVTDVFGNIIEVETEPPTEPEMRNVTDAFGNIIGTEPVEQPTTEESTVEPTTLSFLDQYNSDQKKPDKNGGFAHLWQEEPTNDSGEIGDPPETPTVPPDFVIILDDYR